MGRIIRRPAAGEDDLTVVGVAANIKVDSLSESPAWQMYLPYIQSEIFLVHFVARTSVDADQAALAMASAGQTLDPDMMVWATSTMERHRAVPRLPARLGALVLSVFAVLALALAVIGLYGVSSYGVASRTREVGIRMALGASAPVITRLLAGDGVRLVLVGSVVGLSRAFLVSRLLTDLLVGTQSTDLVAFVGAPVESTRYERSAPSDGTACVRGRTLVARPTHLENEPSKQSSSRSGRSRQPGAGEARSQEDTARA